MSQPNLDQDLNHLVVAFESIAKIKSKFKRDFTLSKTAAYHGLPRAEMRRLFGIWLVERLGGGDHE